VPIPRLTPLALHDSSEDKYSQDADNTPRLSGLSSFFFSEQSAERWSGKEQPKPYLSYSGRTSSGRSCLGVSGRPLESIVVRMELLSSDALPEWRLIDVPFWFFQHGAVEHTS
jgi:hypothetical protein